MKPETLRFTTPALGGVHLHATLRGAAHAATVVLLHGGGANQHWWDRIGPQLARRYRVVALDFRGHGDSDFPEELEVGAFHRDLEALRANLSGAGVALIGHSLGGHVALDHAARHAGVWAVVAIEVSRGAARRERRRTRLALAARRSYASREEAIRRYRLLPASPGVSDRDRSVLAERSVRREADGRWGFKFDPRWFGLPRTPTAPTADVHAPCLVIRGAESTLLSREGAEELTALMPDARSVEVGGAGHNVHLERPDEVLAAIADHLAAHAPGDG